MLTFMVGRHRHGHPLLVRERTSWFSLYGNDSKKMEVAEIFLP